MGHETGMSMLQSAEAKRVRRADLKETHESSGSGNDERGADTALRARLDAQLATWLDLHVGEVKPLADHEVGATGAGAETTGAQSAVPRESFQAADDEDGGGDAGEFDFRLFNTAGSAARVVLQAVENEALGEGGFVSKRPASYYLVKEVAAYKRQQYEAAAVSGEDVVARSWGRSWGLEMPWKVVQTTTTTSTSETEAKRGDGRFGAAVADEKAGRKRPRKRRRIALRKKERARKEVEKLAARRRVEKEEHIKDKKKRLNRVKKLRKRAKTKEKKLALEQGAGAEAVGGSVGRMSVKRRRQGCRRIDCTMSCTARRKKAFKAAKCGC